MGEGSHVTKPARASLQFIKLEHVAVRRKPPKRRIHVASSIKAVKSQTLGALQAERRSEFKTKFAKYPNKEHTSTALGSLPLARRSHVTKRFRSVDCAYYLNNFRRNPF